MLNSNARRAMAAGSANPYPLSIANVQFSEPETVGYGDWVNFPNVGSILLECDVSGTPIGWIAYVGVRQFIAGNWVETASAAWDNGASSCPFDSSIPTQIRIGGEWYGAELLPQSVTVILRDVTAAPILIASATVTVNPEPA